MYQSVSCVHETLIVLVNSCNRKVETKGARL